ncbi:hypothetical protein N1031_05960 [Herbiconiux moechotypicola]|uniref:MmyB-like transcription regulator ligand binding domain-containing protein n=1 Tax=Herbiconiux moechotypicola TaxID=637393 RepID=A0ABN3DFV0_9MICO|nr:hypothetical protein [Herbiconiux moechotypicola]MCS5729300.1 hypothetical protein [Herbiconiux moechotypicola]
MTESEPNEGHRADVVELIDSLPVHPAFVYDRHLTVVASNAAAVVVAPGFAVGSNLARFTFLPSTADTNARDWSAKRDQVAALLRESLHRHLEDEKYLDLVGELATLSPDFASAWAAEPASSPAGEFVFSSPVVGEFLLRYHLFPLAGRSGETLAIWHAPDLAGEEALRRLTSQP